MQARKSEIRILHIGDLHLDSPFDELSPKKSEERRRGLRECFMDMMRYVREENIDLVLISGDLYDARYVTADTVDLLIREFRSAAETHFVIAPGNRDPRSPKSIYAAGRFGNNVHVFEDEVLTRIDFDHFDFLWCPRHKGTDRHFECTKLISAEQVITTIKKIPTFKPAEK